MTFAQSNLCSFYILDLLNEDKEYLLQLIYNSDKPSDFSFIYRVAMHH